MHNNVVFVEFGGNAAHSANATDRIAAASETMTPADGAQTLVHNVECAQTSVREMNTETDTLAQKTEAMAGTTQRLRSAMAELDRAYDQLGSLSKKAREIASYSV